MEFIWRSLGLFDFGPLPGFTELYEPHSSATLMCNYNLWCHQWDCTILRYHFLITGDSQTASLLFGNLTFFLVFAENVVSVFFRKLTAVIKICYSGTCVRRSRRNITNGKQTIPVLRSLSKSYVQIPLVRWVRASRRQVRARSWNLVSGHKRPRHIQQI